jgi:hypothetical protein
MDRIQERLGTGPCFAAAESGSVRVDDVAGDSRWPEFVTQVLRHTPVRAMMVVRLCRDDDRVAVMSFSADRSGAWSDDTADLVHTFTACAGLIVQNRSSERAHRDVLAHRDLIGQAKGMLIERFRIDTPTAFELLAGLARERGMSVAALARRIVRHGSIPDGVNRRGML